MPPLAAARPAPAPQTQRDRWLVVAPARLRGAAPWAVHASWCHLDTALLTRLRPDVIVAPLMTPRWDILDLARVLTDAGFAGRVLIQSGPLPRRDMVLGEIRAAFPRLGVDFAAAA